jgi:hypothetical protein
MAPKSVPLGNKSFVRIKEILSIGGSGIATWVICCVVLTLFPAIKDENATLIMRYCALILSFSFSFVIYKNTNFRLEDDKSEPGNNYRMNVFILWLINGSLIYLNAVGVNSISNGTPFDRKNVHIVNRSSLLPYLNDISWWPDKKLLDSNSSLRIENHALANRYAVIRVENTELNSNLKNNSTHLLKSITSYPYQHVKQGSNIQFDKVDIFLDKFDSNYQVAYVKICKANRPFSYSCDSAITYVKISPNNPQTFSMDESLYAVYLDSIKFGVPPNPKNPAAFFHLNRITKKDPN